MLAALVYLAMLALPGLLLARWWAPGVPGVLAIPAVSLVVAVLALLAAKIGTVDGRWYGAVWLIFTLITAALLWLRRAVTGRAWQLADGAGRAGSLGILAVAAVSAGYAWWAGPYLEVPSDAIWHAGLIREQYQHLANGGQLALGSWSSLFAKYQNYWYFLAAYPMWLSGIPVDAGLGILNVVATTCFMTAFFGFSYAVAGTVLASPARAASAAAIACAFLFLHFGLGVFSFVRYYVFGPVYLNYVIYLASLLALCRYLEQRRAVDRHLLLALVAAPAMAMVHKQEAMFLAVMAATMLLIAGWRAMRRPRAWSTDPRALILAGLVLLAYVVLHGWLLFDQRRANPLAHGTMIDVNVLLPFLKSMYILRPDYQFYQVITIWGVLVYLAYIAAGTWIRQNVLLAAGMLVPAVTLFNPLFADLFLRISWPELLWRLSFVVPLHLVAGLLAVAGWDRLRRGTLRARALAASLLMMLVLLLAPFDFRFVENPYAKLEMLKPVSPWNDARRWDLLLTELSARPPEQVLSDPVTGYVIDTHTWHHYPGHKFSGMGTLKLNHRSYEARDFARYAGWLLVVNKLDGGHSRIGESGRHWSANAMRTSRLYSEGFDELMAANPDMFELLWQAPSQWIYRIR